MPAIEWHAARRRKLLVGARYQQHPSRPKHSCDLADEACIIMNVLDGLKGDNEVECVTGKRNWRYFGEHERAGNARSGLLHGLRVAIDTADPRVACQQLCAIARSTGDVEHISPYMC